MDLYGTGVLFSCPAKFLTCLCSSIFFLLLVFSSTPSSSTSPCEFFLSNSSFQSSSCFFINRTAKMQQENQPPSSKSTSCRKQCQADDQSGVDNPQDVKTQPISPTMTRLSGLGLDIKPHIQPGNAFALLKPIGAHGSNLPRRSSGKPIYLRSSTFFCPPSPHLSKAQDP